MHVEENTEAPPCLRGTHREHCLYTGRLTLTPKQCPMRKRQERSKPRKAVVQTKADKSMEAEGQISGESNCHTSVRAGVWNP